MLGRNIYLLAAGGLALTGCASHRKLPPPPVGAAGDAAGLPGEDAAASGGSNAAREVLQRELAEAAGNDRVLFALDAHTLSETARRTLTAQTSWLQRHPEVNFTIEGHCDERGTREYNLALGDRRAKAASDFLVAQGVSPTRIRTISYGKERPEALGSDEPSHAENRRAVSIVVRAN